MHNNARQCTAQDGMIMSSSVWFNDGSGCFKTWQRPMRINNGGANTNCLPQLEARDYELIST